MSLELSQVICLTLYAFYSVAAKDYSGFNAVILFCIFLKLVEIKRMMEGR